MSARAAAPIVEIVLLSLWLGGALLFAAVVAPAAFAVLPSRALAGALVGRVLPVVFSAGVLIGALSVILESVARTGAWGRTAAGAVLAIACAVAQLLVVPRIDRLRAQISGAVEALAVDDPRRVTFGRLHAVSVGWLGVGMLAAIAALWLATRALPSGVRGDARRAPAPASQSDGGLP